MYKKRIAPTKQTNRSETADTTVPGQTDLEMSSNVHSVQHWLTIELLALTLIFCAKEEKVEKIVYEDLAYIVLNPELLNEPHVQGPSYAAHLAFKLISSANFPGHSSLKCCKINEESLISITMCSYYQNVNFVNIPHLFHPAQTLLNVSHTESATESQHCTKLVQYDLSCDFLVSVGHSRCD